jgi:hypothetical protein
MWKVKCNAIKKIMGKFTLKKVFSPVQKCDVKRLTKYSPVYLKIGAKVTQYGTYTRLSSDSWKVKFKKNVKGNSSKAKKILSYLKEDYNTIFKRYGDRTEEWTLIGKTTGTIKGTVKLKAGKFCRIYSIGNKGVSGGALMVVDSIPCKKITPKPVFRCYTNVFMLQDLARDGNIV